MNGFAESDGDIIALDRTKIEFYNRISREGYTFIALNHLHSLASPANAGTLRDYFSVLALVMSTVTFWKI